MVRLIGELTFAKPNQRALESFQSVGAAGATKPPCPTPHLARCDPRGRGARGKVMRCLTALLITLIALGAPAVAAAPTSKANASVKKNEFASSESILRWINGYRLKPEPTKVPQAARAMSELNLFRDLETAGVYVGFLSGVLETNPKKAETLVSKMFPMPPEDQVVIVRAIAYSNLPDWKALLTKFAERMPARQGLIDRFVQDKMPTFKQIPLDSGPAPLDMLWGKYFATGSMDPVVRMVSILEWSKDQNNVDRLTVGSMAKLTLATNASRDKDLMDMLKASMKHETKENRAVLQEVIEAA